MAMSRADQQAIALQAMQSGQKDFAQGSQNAQDTQMEKLRAFLTGKQKEADVGNALKQRAGEQGQDLAQVKALQDLAPDGAGVHAGGSGVTPDPYAKMLGRERTGGAKAVTDVTAGYMKGLPDIQKQFEAATEGLKFTNDPKNIGSVGTARTLMLKAMGMNRYNENEAGAVLPPTLHSKIATLLNAAGDDSTPLGDNQRAPVNEFFQTMLERSQAKHDLLKQNMLGNYRLSPYFDPQRAEAIKQGLGAPMDQAMGQTKKQYQSMPRTQPEPGVTQQPTSLMDKLKSAFQGQQPQQPPTTQGPPPGMKMQRNSKTGAVRYVPE